ncbi:transcription factor FapR [Fodinisporobacter ferrooxydans]|uniref:Transcription factor FapR n=2 Tax=Fodinisporobacter ferrooxydans TaxID=2901836 RepID=A0ABY4CY98_9BACL|nr:transcription factor FapR [Alicyclobacillaceae bacterium MYW30-H2]
MLTDIVQNEPFLTDEELAERFQVSVQTVRLDRLALGIPEVRERIKAVAKMQRANVRTLDATEVIGEIIDLEFNTYGISILDVGTEHVFAKTKMMRGHHLFAQANSLAIALMDTDVAVTATADVRFLRPVLQGERLVCKAVVESGKRDRIQVRVITKAGDDVVFEGTFLVVRLRKWEEGTNHEVGS